MKKRVISLMLCLVMLIGIVPMSLFTVSAGTEEYKEYHVDTFDELKSALEESNPTQTKKIIVDKSIEYQVDYLGEDNCKNEINVTDDNILVISNKVHLSITADSFCGTSIPMSAFKIGKGASLSILGDNSAPTITVDSDSEFRTFDLSGGTLNLFGGCYIITHKHKFNSDLISQDIKTYPSSFINSALNSNINIIKANIEFESEPWIGHSNRVYDYCCDKCFSFFGSEYNFALIDSKIIMKSAITKDIDEYEGNEIFNLKNPKYSFFNVLNTQFYTDTYAQLKADKYSSYNILKSNETNSIYQNGIETEYEDFDNKLTGTTTVTCTENKIDTHFVNSSDNEEKDSVRYYSGMSESDKNFEIADNVFETIKDMKAPDGLSLPFSYAEKNYWLIYDETDGTQKPVSYKSGAITLNNYYVSDKRLNLDELNDDIVGGIEGKILHIVDAYAVTNYSGNSQSIIRRNCDNDMYIYGGECITRVDFEKDIDKYIYKGRVLGLGIVEEDEDSQRKIISVYQKQAIENGKKVWKDMKAGDKITAGSYRIQVYVIPKNGYIVNKQTKVILTGGGGGFDRELVSYPNDYPNCQDIALECDHNWLYKTISAGAISTVNITDSTIKAGDTLNQNGPIKCQSTTGVKSVDYLYERNGKTVLDGTKVTYGDYDCCVILHADDDYAFNSKTTINYKGNSYAPECISEDGKTCWFQMPTVHIDCEHTASSWQKNATLHWQICSTCGTKFNEGEHNYNQSISGTTVTYTCKDCGYVKTGKVAETRTPASYIMLKLGTAFVGSTKPSTVGLDYMTDSDSNKYYDFATVSKVEWSKSGNIFTNEKQTVTVTIKANSNYYFKSSTIPSTTDLQYSRDSITLVDDTTIKVTFSFTPYTPADVKVTLPEFTVGKTYADIAKSAKLTLNGNAVTKYSVSIKENGGESALIDVNNGVASGAAAWLTPTIKADSMYEFGVTIQLGDYYGKSITVTNPSIAAVTDSYAGEILASVNATYTTSANKINFAFVDGVTEPVCGKAIATTASPVGQHYKVKSATYNATGNFLCNTEYTVTVTLEAIDGYTFVEKDSIKGATINGKQAKITSVATNGSTLTMQFTFEKIPHTFGEWKYNETRHWKECTVSGCTEKQYAGVHNFVNDVCSDCGYVRHIMYDLIVCYQYENGVEAKEAYYAEVEKGKTYSVTSPVIDGYTADTATVNGTMTEDTIIYVTYTEKAKITNYCSSITVDFKSTVVLNATSSSKSNFAWFYEDGSKACDGATYKGDKLKGTVKIYAANVDANGKIIEGTQSDMETINVKTGFFDKFIAVFRGWFGLLPLWVDNAKSK